MRLMAEMAHRRGYSSHSSAMEPERADGRALEARA